MKLEEYKKTNTKPQIQSTLCFLIKEDQILLAMKKRGFGIGKYNGVGGKKNPEESLEEAAKRETHEEIGITITSIEQAATLDFYFPYSKHSGQKVAGEFIFDENEKITDFNLVTQ